MADHGIIFQGWGVRAILAGLKWETRRIIKPQPTRTVTDWSSDAEEGEKVIYRGWPHYLRESRGRNKAAAGELTPARVRCPHGVVGDRMWVREKHAFRIAGDPSDWDNVCYAADGKSVWCRVSEKRVLDAPKWQDRWQKEDIQRWRPSIHMPKWAARIWRPLTNIRVQRVQDITEEDAIAEGVEPREFDENGTHTGFSYRTGFRCVWTAIHGPGAWERNDWVWALTFERKRDE